MPRGRPRSDNPTTAVERAAAAEERLLAAGGERKTVRLSAVAAKRARDLVKTRGGTFAGLVERLILAGEP